MKKPTPKPEDGEPGAREAAIRLLARREHAHRELRAKLEARGFHAADVTAALDGLVAEGLLSDARFAEQFVRHRVERGQGPVRIRVELRERGVDDAVIERYLDDADATWTERLAAVRERRFGPHEPQSVQERQRQARFLHQRGFTWRQIGRALRGLPDEDGD